MSRWFWNTRLVSSRLHTFYSLNSIKSGYLDFWKNGQSKRRTSNELWTAIEQDVLQIWSSTSFGVWWERHVGKLAKAKSNATVSAKINDAIDHSVHLRGSNTTAAPNSCWGQSFQYVVPYVKHQWTNDSRMHERNSTSPIFIEVDMNQRTQSCDLASKTR